MNISNKTKQNRLNDIRLRIIEEHICPDLAATATNIVFGEGDCSSEIVFIGEAPGRNEDLIGKPFVGAAGKFLNEMLAMIGMQRQNIYITNIVKYRPPNNRDPLPSEKSAFLPFLVKQLQIIAPKLVITLGRHSMNSFLLDKQISKIHGQQFIINLKDYEPDLPDNMMMALVPLYHPAAALYNPGQRQLLINDFLKIPNVMLNIKKSYLPA